MKINNNTDLTTAYFLCSQNMNLARINAKKNLENAVHNKFSIRMK
jgi:hypothetical protein